MSSIPSIRAAAPVRPVVRSTPAKPVVRAEAPAATTPKPLEAPKRESYSKPLGMAMMGALGTVGSAAGLLLAGLSGMGPHPVSLGLGVAFYGGISAAVGYGLGRLVGSFFKTDDRKSLDAVSKAAAAGGAVAGLPVGYMIGTSLVGVPFGLTAGMIGGAIAVGAACYGATRFMGQTLFKKD